jgi:peptidoglycan biosynthesis protein MviN/MurJ (putative lipid II flippase)
MFALLQSKYVEATPLVWVLVPCLFLESMLTTAHNALIVYEKLRVIVISRLLTLVCVPLVIFLFPLLGGMGAALAFGLARVLAGVWATANGYRLLGLRWPWQFSGRVALAAAAMGAVVSALGHFIAIPAVTANRYERFAVLPPLLLITILGACVFIIALRLLGGLDPQDRRQVMQLKLPGKKWLLLFL